MAVFAVVGLPYPAEVRVDAQETTGQILAPVGRQAGWLNLDTRRPQLLTTLTSPAFVSDVGAVAGVRRAALAVMEPFGGSGDIGGDLLGLDLSSSELTMLVARADASESLGAPAWWPNGGGLVFQRQDFSVTGIVYAGSATVVYPSRIEVVLPDAPDTGRRILIADGRQPALAPDGVHLAFLRSSAAGTSLRVGDGLDEQVLVPEGRFSDLAYPRYSPRGDQIAFAAPGSGAFGGEVPSPLAGLVAKPAWAHGVPWDLWLVNADGSNIRRLAELGADDGSVAWSPDGRQLFMYGGTGSFVVDAASGEVSSLGYVSGYGAVAWLP
jgi:hypothetical protein